MKRIQTWWINIKKNTLVVLCMIIFLAFLSYGLAAAIETPILHVSRGGVDVREIINHLFPDVTSIDKVIADKKTIDGYGDDIGNIKSHRDIYSLDGVQIFVQEPSGEIIIEWHSETKDNYDQVMDKQLKEHDPDGDNFLSDGHTLLWRQEKDVSEESEAMFAKAKAFAQDLSKKLDLVLIPHHASARAFTRIYHDGQTLQMGEAKYGIIRNGLPVETMGLWSEISRTGLYIEPEYLTLEWYGDEIVRAIMHFYKVESEENTGKKLISQEDAQKTIKIEIEKITAITGQKPFVDLCYMPAPDRKGELYAQLVPAWRFRFLGEYTEDDSCHRIHAYTGEVIR